MNRRTNRANRRDNKTQLRVGDVVAARTLVSIADEPVAVPDPDMLTHLQFRRFAGCPFCTLHLASIARHHDEISAASVKEVVLFHSTVEALRKHQDRDLPFPVVPDPDKKLYREFGVESSLLSVLHPRAWLPELRGPWSKRRSPGFDLHGGPLGLPADLLIGPDGRVVAVKYGDHAYDQWPVTELLALASDFTMS